MVSICVGLSNNNMKRISLIILLAVLINACKKGPNDPKVSLLSRKSRMTGNWTMQKGHVSITTFKQGASPFNSNFELNSGKAHLTQTGTLIAYILTYNLYLKIEKDGKFSLTEDFDNYSMAADGSWNFSSGVGKKKNKEDVFFKLTNVRIGDSQEHLFNNLSTEISYQIKELRNEKLVLYAATKLYLNAYGEKANFEAEYTFTKNK
jgi:hypothetical protein